MIENIDDQLNPLFVKGFNSGYTIQKFEAKLMDQILKGIEPSNSQFLDGLRLGSAEFKKELFRDRLNNANQKNTSRDNDRDFGLEQELK